MFDFEYKKLHLKSDMAEQRDVIISLWKIERFNPYNSEIFFINNGNQGCFLYEIIMNVLGDWNTYTHVISQLFSFFRRSTLEFDVHRRLKSVLGLKRLK